MENHEKISLFPCRGTKNLRINSWYSLTVLKHDQKFLIRIPSLNVPQMRSFSTFWSILANGYHGNNDCQKNFSFGNAFPSSMTVQSFSAIKWQEKKLSMIKIFNFLVFDHLKANSKLFNNS